MAKIQCPHCKAMNQDVSLDDPCWQCGTILGAPITALDTGVGPATSAANPSNAGGPMASVSETPPTPAPTSQAQQPLSVEQKQKVRTNNTVAIAAIVIALIVIVIFLALKLMHR